MNKLPGPNQINLRMLALRDKERLTPLSGSLLLVGIEDSSTGKLFPEGTRAVYFGTFEGNMQLTAFYNHHGKREVRRLSLPSDSVELRRNVLLSIDYHPSKPVFMHLSKVGGQF